MKQFSLRAQLNSSIFIILILSLIGSAWINVVNTQSYLNAQLSSHAQDTATSLGLSLREALANKEMPLAEATINAIFDRGFYHHIILQDPYGNLLYEKVNNNQPEQVPSWFIHLFQLSAPEKQSMIDTGWTVGGVLKVQSHTGAAYAQLWDSANDFSIMTSFIFFIALFIGYLLLLQVYKPINAISMQAKAVQNREFVLIEKLPRAKELQNFVVAMNQMVMSIQNTFQELTEAAEKTRKDAYVDAQTGIANRRAFNDALQASLSISEQKRGHLVMVRLSGLAQYNQQHGYSAGDNLINKLVKYIGQEIETKTDAKLYRLSGSELAFFVFHQQHKNIELICESLVKQFHRRLELESYLNTAVAAVPFQSEEESAKLMYQLDTAVNLALESSAGYYVAKFGKQEGNKVTSASNFKSIIQSIIDSPELYLSIKSQKVQSLSERRSYELEIFAAFSDGEGALNTGDVFAMAAQFDLTSELDLLIVKKTLGLFERFNPENKKILLNLCKATLNDVAVMQQIIEMIETSGYGDYLVFGLTEASVLTNQEQATKLLNKLKESGCAICINRFGSSIASLTYLMKLRPSIVKLESAFTAAIQNKPDNQQLVGEFVRMAHGLNIAVVAQCVESAEELTLLETLHVDAALGYVIDKPKLVVEK